MPPAGAHGGPVLFQAEKTRQVTGMFGRDGGAGCWRIFVVATIALAVLGAVLIGVYVLQIHAFLTLQKPVAAGTIVVPGNLPDSALERIAAEVVRQPQLKILAVGGPIGRGSHLGAYKSYANLAAATLVELGVPESAIVTIPAPAMKRDRVYASALALADCLKQSPYRPKSVNVYAEGVRGRRTLLLFGEALAPEVQVGVISVPDEDYEPAAWWSTSEGFRTVTGETLAYLYVKVFFRPRSTISDAVACDITYTIAGTP